jgi:putative SOS response-associated peptidase YedK
MCGRYVSTKSTSDLLEEFDAFDATSGQATEVDYNVAPTTQVRTVLTRAPREATVDSSEAEPSEAEPSEAEPSEAEPEAEPPAPVRQLRVARWGLVPSWAKDISVGNRFFNARSESVPDKPAFARAFAKRRCLIPADGWYEWQRETGPDGKPRKQPFLMVPQDGHSLALAGLYEFWRPKGAGAEVPILLSVTVLTTAAQGELAEIHDRMPLVLRRQDWQRWLDPTVAAPSELLLPHDEVADESLELRPVSSKVNSVRNNSADLIEPIAHPAPGEQAQALELF